MKAPPTTFFIATLMSVGLSSAEDVASRSDFKKGLWLSKDCSVYFATVAEAKASLAERDVYVKNLSAFEKAAKIKKAGPVSTEQYVAFIQNQALEWGDADKKKLLRVIAIAKPKLAKFANLLPERIHLIKTTGNDEGAAPYTRGVSIILPERFIRQSAKSLERLFYHELFHILSRSNPKLRDELYKIIGYEKCDEVSLPDDMMPRRISNPDAPVVEHCIRLSKDGESHWCAPVLFSRTPKYDPKTGSTFFRYLQFRLMAIDRKTSRAILKDGKPILWNHQTVEGFFEQIGRNTDYVIHPEETLANNFIHLMTAKQDLTNPGIPKKIEAVLKSH
ncbi:MAG: hypothetical protein CMI26_10905 [Opitutae bacterium]|nr:hypothetical protein [Opitutae bacterium]